MPCTNTRTLQPVVSQRPMHTVTPSWLSSPTPHQGWNLHVCTCPNQTKDRHPFGSDKMPLEQMRWLLVAGDLRGGLVSILSRLVGLVVRSEAGDKLTLEGKEYEQRDRVNIFLLSIYSVEKAKHVVWTYIPCQRNIGDTQHFADASTKTSSSWCWYRKMRCPRSLKSLLLLICLRLAFFF